MLLCCIKLLTFFQGYILATEILNSDDNTCRKRTLGIGIEDDEHCSKRKCFYKEGIDQNGFLFSDVSTNDQFLESLCDSLGFPIPNNDYDCLDNISGINILPDVEQSTSFIINNNLGVESNTMYSLNVTPTPFAKMHFPLQRHINLTDMYKDKVTEVTEIPKITKDTNTYNYSSVLHNDLNVKTDVLPHINTLKSITEYHRPNLNKFDITKTNEDMNNCINGRMFNVNDNLKLTTNTTSQKNTSAIASFNNSTIYDQKDSISFNQNWTEADINFSDNCFNLSIPKNTNKTTELKFKDKMSTNQNNPHKSNSNLRQNVQPVASYNDPLNIKKYTDLHNEKSKSLNPIKEAQRSIHYNNTNSLEMLYEPKSQPRYAFDNKLISNTYTDIYHNDSSSYTMTSDLPLLVLGTKIHQDTINDKFKIAYDYAQHPSIEMNDINEVTNIFPVTNNDNCMQNGGLEIESNRNHLFALSQEANMVSPCTLKIISTKIYINVYDGVKSNRVVSYDEFYRSKRTRIPELRLLNEALNVFYKESIDGLASLKYAHINDLCLFFGNTAHDLRSTYKTIRSRLEEITKVHFSGNIPIEITESVYLEIFDNIQNNVHLQPNLQTIKDKLEEFTDKIVILHFSFDKIRTKYLAFVVEVFLEFDVELGLYVLHKDLWGLHAYMAEFYFYLMWNIKKITEFVPIDAMADANMIQHLQDEIGLLKDIMLKYMNVDSQKSYNKKEYINLMKNIVRFRMHIWHFLNNFYPRSTEEALYYMGLNIRHKTVHVEAAPQKSSKNKKDSNTSKKKPMKPAPLHQADFCSIVKEKKSAQNMFFISAFTFHCSNYQDLVLDNLKLTAVKSNVTLSEVWYNFHFKKRHFQEQFINSIINICNFLKYIRRNDNNNKKILLPFPTKSQNFIIYADTSNKETYQLKIMPHSYAMYFYSEYIRSHMW